MNLHFTTEEIIESFREALIRDYVESLQKQMYGEYEAQCKANGSV